MRPGGRGFVYARVSGRAQASDGTSLEGQEGAGRRHLESVGCKEPVVRVEVESGGEEKIERRTVLHALVREAVAGDLVVVAALDRWSRDLVWGLQSIRALVDRGVGFYAIREALDAATPAGRERLGLLLWVAESERSRIRDRTVGRADELRRSGLWAYGSVPWGYQRGPREERRHLYLEADEHAGDVREMHERAAGGESLRSLVQWTAAHAGPRQVAALHRVLHGRIYLGEIWVGAGHHRREGAWVKGLHPALVTPELWQQVQDTLAGRRVVAQPPPTSVAAVDLLLAGTLVCGLCGRRCSVGWVDKGGNYARYRYLVCFARRRREQDVGGPPRRCAGPYARVEPLEKAAVEAVLERLGELREVLAGRGSPRRGGNPVPAQDFAGARRRVELRLARAVSAFTDGTLKAEELATQRTRLDGELVKLRAREQTQAREARAADPKARGDMRRALGNLRKTWREATIEERRRILRLLAAKVELLEDRTLRWTWRSVEDLLTE